MTWGPLQFSQNNGINPGLVNIYTFNAVRRNSALNQGMLAKNLELLRRLMSEQFLLALRFTQIGQIPTGTYNTPLSANPLLERVTCFSMDILVGFLLDDINL